jgi:hypothetical protein
MLHHDIGSDYIASARVYLSCSPYQPTREGFFLNTVARLVTQPFIRGRTAVVQNITVDKRYAKGNQVDLSATRLLASLDYARTGGGEL